MTTNDSKKETAEQFVPDAAMNFAAYLIDHCEGETVTEESVQVWLGKMAKLPRYNPTVESALASMTRMFHAACADLGAINEALGLDPDDGGAEPIIDEIIELKAALATSASALARDEASVPQIKPSLLNQLRRFNDCCEDPEAGGHDVDKEDIHSLAELGAVRPAPGGRHYLTDFGHYLLTAPACPAASSAATVSDAASVLTGNQRDAILHHCRLYLDDESGKYNAKSVLTRIFSIAAATTAGAQELAPNQIQVTHTIATADNAATILHALLDSFVEVSAGFPQAKIDDGLANQVRIYLPAASSATPLTSDSDAARDVLAERQRQVTAEGWTPEHDDEHTESEMALAAACYAMAAGGYAKGQTPPIWPWSLSWWKPAYGRRDLVKAGALILAEIERIDRTQSTNGEQS